jgi:multidrug transporter EmrE-like cation transporter
MHSSQLLRHRVAALLGRAFPITIVEATSTRLRALLQIVLCALPTPVSNRLRRMRKETVMLYALLFVAIAFEVAGDLIFRKWGIEQRWPLFVIALVSYNIAAVAWGYSLRFTQVSTGIVLLGVLNVALVVIGGVLLFKEKLTTMQTLGVLLGLASLALLNAD